MTRISQQGLANENPSAARAAFMSLDRMTLRDPSLLSAAFGSDPAWMDFAPKPRASLMSRLDITDPGQQVLFLQYLSKTSHGPGEMDYFAEIFPNGNFPGRARRFLQTHY